jgi:hypothetical protein
VSGPLAVRLRTGPVHLGFPLDDAHVRAVCGGRFGEASVVRQAAWNAPRLRRCAACEDAAFEAETVEELRARAGV